MEDAKKLPGAYMGELTKDASVVGTWLKKENADNAVMDSFRRMCDRLMIPYVFDLEQKDGIAFLWPIDGER